MNKLQILSLLTVLLCLGVAHADDGCRVLKCFSCNSVDHPNCLDPFNYTEHITLEKCRGWCVKIVEHIGTDNERVLRTCTDKMHIDPFMVGHMCMEESGGHGSLCFCRKDRCNGSAIPSISFLLLFVLSTLHFFLSLRN